MSDDIVEKLPCDVHLPPNTYIRKGCNLGTLLIALKQREGRNEADTTFPQPEQSTADQGRVT